MGHWLKRIFSSHFSSYDYIIVGGGTAGSTLAARLSEVPQNRILLLDGGYRETGFSVTPGNNALMPKSYQVWDHVSEPEKNSARGMKNKSVPSYVSRLLGGGSAHNQLEWVRGEPQDYDRWVHWVLMAGRGEISSHILLRVKGLSRVNWVKHCKMKAIMAVEVQ